MAAPGYSAAAARNAAPILGVLRRELAAAERVLEIGSGTGHHAVHFAAAMPHLEWQTSDLDENHARIAEQISAAGLDNVLPPLSLDVRNAAVPAGTWDAVYACNTKHIMSAAAVDAMLALVAELLPAGGRYLYYGPFRRNGRFTTPSNEAFDASLKARSPEMGLRDFDAVDRRLGELGFERDRLYAMPTNNLLAAWTKGDAQR